MEHVKHIMENMDYYGFILINMEHPLGTIMENTDYYGYGKYGNIIGISWDLTIKYRYFHVVSMEYIYIYIYI
jgi:hypothetical protein